MKPELPCCDAHWTTTGSGGAWYHSRSCKDPTRRNQKVRPGEDHPVMRRRSSWWTPTPYAGKAAEVIAFKAHTGRW